MARVAGAVLGGSLALITFSYLLVVAAIVDRLVSPMNLLDEAMVLLRQAEQTPDRADRPIADDPGVGPREAKPTVEVAHLRLEDLDLNHDPTEAGTWAADRR
jgi:hypothetical protein